MRYSHKSCNSKILEDKKDSELENSLLTMHGVVVDGVGRQRLWRRGGERRRKIPEAEPVDGRLTSRAARPLLLLHAALRDRQVILRVGGRGGGRGGSGCKKRQAFLMYKLQIMPI